MMFGCVAHPGSSLQVLRSEISFANCDDMKQGSLSLLYAFQRVLD